MTERPNAASRLGRLPRSERRGALEALVVQEFRGALLMSDDDVLPLDENYFDLGLTSLTASAVRQRLEEELDCELDTAAMFGAATVRDVIEHLAAAVLPELAAPSASDRGGPDHRQQVNDLIADLYGS
ncbi:hypothetical protein GCM10022254_20330 [Actinomadura meridiana]|uniref:Carrier domain-containing protein n=1 Tax=Actinomadura meridiana TaxID=559626 RepID=A0ABP8BWU7_9ACTN